MSKEFDPQSIIPVGDRNLLSPRKATIQLEFLQHVEGRIFNGYLNDKYNLLQAASELLTLEMNKIDNGYWLGQSNLRLLLESADYKNDRSDDNLFIKEVLVPTLEEYWSFKRAGKDFDSEKLASLVRLTQFIEESNSDIKVNKHNFGNVENIFEVTNGEATLYFDNEGKLVYSSEENNKFTYSNLGEFLGSNHVDKQIEVHSGKAKKVALFGTIGSNLGYTPIDWMQFIQDEVGEGLVFNPNLKTHIQSSEKINLNQFADESMNLFESEVIFMNFEPRRGGIALSELRIAMIASILTGHDLIVRLEQPDENDVNVIRSRAIAEAEMEFLMNKFPNARVQLIKSKIAPISDEEMQRGVLTTKLIDMKNEYQDCANLIRTKLERRNRERENNIPNNGIYKSSVSMNFSNNAILTGSSRTTRDMAIRLELMKQYRLATGISLMDSINPNFDGDSNLSRDERIKIMKENRRAELESMYNSKKLLVHVGLDSLSPFQAVGTALLISILTGAEIGVEVDMNVDRENYGGSTYRSHTGKALLSEDLYNVMKVAKLIGDLQYFGIAPQLAKKIKSISDALTPVINALS